MAKRSLVASPTPRPTASQAPDQDRARLVGPCASESGQSSALSAPAGRPLAILLPARWPHRTFHNVLSASGMTSLSIPADFAFSYDSLRVGFDNRTMTGLRLARKAGRGKVSK